MTGPMLQNAPRPLRGAFWSLVIVMVLGVLGLLFTALQGGIPGVGLVFLAISVIAVVGVRQTAEGRPNWRVVSTALGVILVLYRSFIVYLLVGFDNSGLPTATIVVWVAQLTVEVVLIITAIVLMYRPEVNAFLASGK